MALRQISVFCLCLCPGALFSANLQDVVINEIAWSGTAAGASDEWMEMKNTTSADIALNGWTLKAADGAPAVVLQGTIPAGGYFLLERTDDQTVSDVPADQLFTGALANGPPSEDLVLLDASSNTIDQALFQASGWPAGTSSPGFFSMERVSPALPGSNSTNWKSNSGLLRNGLDADGGALNATPKAQNSVFGTPAESCQNALDDDGDGFKDCADPDCAGFFSCAGGGAGEALQVNPALNPFSPRDPDPRYRAGQIFFNAGADDAVKTIRVTDLGGRLRRTLVNNDQASDGQSLAGAAAGGVFWDGKDDQGRALPPGLYVVFLEAASPSGGRVRARDTIAIGK